MLQWFICFPEFAEFSEFLFYLGKNSSIVNLLSSSFSSFVLVLSSSWDTLARSSLVSILVVTDTDVVVTPLLACLRGKKMILLSLLALVYYESQESSFVIEYKYLSLVIFWSR